MPRRVLLRRDLLDERPDVWGDLLRERQRRLRLSDHAVRRRKLQGQHGDPPVDLRERNMHRAQPSHGELRGLRLRQQHGRLLDELHGKQPVQERRQLLPGHLRRGRGAELLERLPVRFRPVPRRLLLCHDLLDERSDLRRDRVPRREWELRRAVPLPDLPVRLAQLQQRDGDVSLLLFERHLPSSDDAELRRLRVQLERDGLQYDLYNQRRLRNRR